MAASTLDVTNLSNSGTVVGSLGYELGLARNGDTIVFDPTLSGGMIDLAATLVIGTNVIIEGHIGGGAGSPDITLGGDDAVTVLGIAPDATRR